MSNKFVVQELVYGGQVLEAGEPFPAGGSPNDSVLERVGYVTLVLSEPVTCDQCGKVFATQAFLNLHRMHRCKSRRLAEPAAETSPSRTYKRRKR